MNGRQIISVEPVIANHLRINGSGDNYSLSVDFRSTNGPSSCLDQRVVARLTIDEACIIATELLLRAPVHLVAKYFSESQKQLGLLRDLVDALSTPDGEEGAAAAGWKEVRETAGRAKPCTCPRCAS